MASSLFSKEKIEPKPGDISICFGCAAVNQYTADMGLETCPSEVLLQLDADEQESIRKLQCALKARQPN